MNSQLFTRVRIWIEIIAVLALLSVGVKTMLQAYESPAEVGVSTWTQTYVGLKEGAALKQAQSEQVEARVVKREGVPQPIFEDLRPNRLNFTIQGGRVVDVDLY